MRTGIPSVAYVGRDETVDDARGSFEAPSTASCGGGAVSSDPWGRVDETGTVYVRTADGEQVVGSWQAGSPEEALAYFERKYEGLVVEIGLLEKRVQTTDLSAKDAQAAIDHLRQQVDAHHAVGDLDALRRRLDRLVASVEARREERKAQRARQSDQARRAKEELVEEAEQLAQSDQWRADGVRRS